MEIRKAQPADLDRIMEIYRAAKLFMDRTGNPTQWVDGYPRRELVEQEIQQGVCHLCIVDGKIEGVFMLIGGEEPTYAKIYQGQWLSDAPYHTIHRMASSGNVKGIGDFCFGWCFQHYPNIRIDTHNDNKVMQRVIERNGFVRCGQIFVKDGSPRIAYQRTVK